MSFTKAIVARPRGLRRYVVAREAGNRQSAVSIADRLPVALGLPAAKLHDVVVESSED